MNWCEKTSCMNGWILNFLDIDTFMFSCLIVFWFISFFLEIICTHRSDEKVLNVLLFLVGFLVKIVKHQQHYKILKSDENWKFNQVVAVWNNQSGPEVDYIDGKLDLKKRKIVLRSHIRSQQTGTDLMFSGIADQWGFLFLIIPWKVVDCFAIRDRRMTVIFASRRNRLELPLF